MQLIRFGCLPLFAVFIAKTRDFLTLQFQLIPLKKISKNQPQES